MKKKTFVFYGSWLNVISELPPDVQLEIYQATAEYAINGNLVELKPMAKIAFTFIKQDIDRDTDKYMSIVERNRENGKKGGKYGKLGGRPKKSETPKNPQRGFQNPKNPIDNDNDNDLNIDDGLNIPPNPLKGDSSIISATSDSDFQSLTHQEEGKRKKVAEKKEKFDFRKSLLRLGISEKLVDDWLIVRKNKRMSNTQTAFERIKIELEKSAFSFDDSVRIAIEKSWGGFKHEWLINQLNETNKKFSSTSKKRNLENFASNIEQGIARAEARKD